MDVVIVDFQGFKDNQNKYVVKELCIGDVGTASENYYLFAPPFPKEYLYRSVQISNDWCTRNLHGFLWEDGTVPYNRLREILKEMTRDFRIVMTKGDAKKIFLEELLHRQVVDFNIILPIRMQNLPDPKIYCQHYGSCARRNLLKLLNWTKLLFTTFEFKHKMTASCDANSREDISEVSDNDDAFSFDFGENKEDEGYDTVDSILQ